MDMFIDVDRFYKTATQQLLRFRNHVGPLVANVKLHNSSDGNMGLDSDRTGSVAECLFRYVEEGVQRHFVPLLCGGRRTYWLLQTLPPIEALSQGEELSALAVAFALLIAHTGVAAGLRFSLPTLAGFVGVDCLPPDPSELPDDTTDTDFFWKRVCANEILRFTIRDTLEDLFGKNTLAAIPLRELQAVFEGPPMDLRLWREETLVTGCRSDESREKALQTLFDAVKLTGPVEVARFWTGQPIRPCRVEGKIYSCHLVVYEDTIAANPTSCDPPSASISHRTLCVDTKWIDAGAASLASALREAMMRSLPFRSCSSDLL
jgi:hypothetical protein